MGLTPKPLLIRRKHVEDVAICPELHDRCVKVLAFEINHSSHPRVWLGCQFQREGALSLRTFKSCIFRRANNLPEPHATVERNGDIQINSRQRYLVEVHVLAHFMFFRCYLREGAKRYFEDASVGSITLSAACAAASPPISAEALSMTTTPFPVLGNSTT